MTSSGNSGSSCLTPASLTPGTSAAVSTLTTPGTSRAGAGAQAGHPGVRVRRLDRVGVQHAVHPLDEVVGVERRAGDVQGGALVRQGPPDDGALGSLGEGAHAGTPCPASVVLVEAHSLRSDWPSMAAR